MVEVKWRGFLVVMFAIVLMPFVTAEVVVFDKYDTTATVTGKTIKIDREVRIKNVGKAPIIPGELHFRLYENKGGEKRPLKITGFAAESNRGEKLGTKITERSDGTDLAVTLWNPLLPGFHYEFTMTYELNFKPSGILFYELKLPQEETTIPIVNDETQFLLDDKFHVTYAPESTVNKLSGNTVVTWTNADDSRVIEYSRLPLPKIGIRAVNVFWVIIIALLAAMFIMTVRRQRQRPSASTSPQYNPYQYPPQNQQPPYGRR